MIFVNTKTHTPTHNQGQRTPTLTPTQTTSPNKGDTILHIDTQTYSSTKIETPLNGGEQDPNFNTSLKLLLIPPFLHPQSYITYKPNGHVAYFNNITQLNKQHTIGNHRLKPNTTTSY